MFICVSLGNLCANLAKVYSYSDEFCGAICFDVCGNTTAVNSVISARVAQFACEELPVPLKAKQVKY